MRYRDIKLMVVDVDGVVTDGLYEVNSNGDISKTFFTRDFHILEKLMERGIKVLFLTSSQDDCIKNKVNLIAQGSEKWDNFIKKNQLIIKKGVISKKKELIEYARKFNLSTNKSIAYIGDAENDIEAIRICFCTACPADAIDEVHREANFICTKMGGKGAVYEFGEHILYNIKKEIRLQEKKKNENSNAN